MVVQGDYPLVNVHIYNYGKNTMHFQWVNQLYIYINIYIYIYINIYICIYIYKDWAIFNNQ